MIPRVPKWVLKHADGIDCIVGIAVDGAVTLWMRPRETAEPRLSMTFHRAKYDINPHACWALLVDGYMKLRRPN